MKIFAQYFFFLSSCFLLSGSLQASSFTRVCDFLRGFCRTVEDADQEDQEELVVVDPLVAVPAEVATVQDAKSAAPAAATPGLRTADASTQTASSEFQPAVSLDAIAVYIAQERADDEEFDDEELDIDNSDYRLLDDHYTSGLARGSDFQTYRRKRDHPLLHLAAELGHAAMVEYLRNLRPPFPFGPDLSGHSPLVRLLFSISLPSSESRFTDKGGYERVLRNLLSDRNADNLVLLSNQNVSLAHIVYLTLARMALWSSNIDFDLDFTETNQDLPSEFSRPLTQNWITLAKNWVKFARLLVQLSRIDLDAPAPDFFNPSDRILNIGNRNLVRQRADVPFHHLSLLQQFTALGLTGGVEFLLTIGADPLRGQSRLGQNAHASLAPRDLALHQARWYARFSSSFVVDEMNRALDSDVDIDSPNAVKTPPEEAFPALFQRISFSLRDAALPIPRLAIRMRWQIRALPERGRRRTGGAIHLHIASFLVAPSVVRAMRAMMLAQVPLVAPRLPSASVPQASSACCCAPSISRRR
jgi:hypothetical protein